MYALIGVDESGLFRKRYLTDGHERPATRLEAAAFDADASARLAADAGRRHLIITSRRHDGFSMCDSALSNDKVAKAAGRCYGLVSALRLDLS